MTSGGPLSSSSREPLSEGQRAEVAGAVLYEKEGGADPQRALPGESKRGVQSQEAEVGWRVSQSKRQ